MKRILKFEFESSILLHIFNFCASISSRKSYSLCFTVQILFMVRYISRLSTIITFIQKTSIVSNYTLSVFIFWLYLTSKNPTRIFFF